MKCPRCGGEMAELKRYGETLDTCTECGGIWLDKGALGAIIRKMEGALLGGQGEHGPCHGKKRKTFLDFFN